MVELIAFGANTIDEYYDVSHWPQPGDKAFISNRQVFVGGMIGNAASVFSQLGNQTIMFDYLPDDDSKNLVIETLKKHKVNTDYIEINSGFSLCRCLIYLHQEERIVYIHKNTHQFTLSQKQIKRLKKDKLFYCNIEDLSQITNIEAIKKSGISVIIDVEYNALKKTKDYMKYFKLASILFLNENAYNHLNEINPYWETNVSIKYIIISYGKRGSKIKYNNQIFNIPACPAIVVDSTGAGDTFHASFIHAINNNYSALESMRFASAAASLSITKMGPRGHIKNENMVIEYACKKNYQIRCN